MTDFNSAAGPLPADVVAAAKAAKNGALLPVPEAFTGGILWLANMEADRRRDVVAKAIQSVNMNNSEVFLPAGIEPGTGRLVWIGLWATDQCEEDQSEGKCALYVCGHYSPDWEDDEVDDMGGMLDDGLNSESETLTEDECLDAANFVLETCQLS
jgi:hypothetical protein